MPWAGGGRARRDPGHPYRTETAFGLAGEPAGELAAVDQPPPTLSDRAQLGHRQCPLSHANRRSQTRRQRHVRVPDQGQQALG